MIFPTLLPFALYFANFVLSSSVIATQYDTGICRHTGSGRMPFLQSCMALQALAVNSNNIFLSITTSNSATASLRRVFVSMLLFHHAVARQSVLNMLFPDESNHGVALCQPPIQGRALITHTIQRQSIFDTFL